MNDVFLGIIAVSVLTMALVQVAIVILTLRASERITKLTSQFEQEIRPVVANLRTITADAAKATAVAATQVERADKLFNDVAARLDQTLAAIHTSVVGATRGGGAWLAGLKAALAVLRDLRQSPRSRSASVEEEDALFIG